MFLLFLLLLALWVYSFPFFICTQTHTYYNHIKISENYSNWFLSLYLLLIYFDCYCNYFTQAYIQSIYLFLGSFIHYFNYSYYFNNFIDIFCWIFHWISRKINDIEMYIYVRLIFFYWNKKFFFSSMFGFVRCANKHKMALSIYKYILYSFLVLFAFYV